MNHLLTDETTTLHPRDSASDGTGHEPGREDALVRVGAMLRAQLQRAPYHTLGMAAGLGLAIGGGMWQVLARSLVGVVARVAVAAVIPPAPAPGNDRFTTHSEV